MIVKETTNLGDSFGVRSKKITLLYLLKSLCIKKYKLHLIIPRLAAENHEYNHKSGNGVVQNLPKP